MIDDVHGWRFNSADGTDPEPGGDKFIQDDNGHGTHVSGIAAAATDNGIGVAGVAWHSPIMTVKVLTQYSWGWYSDIAAGILYAADNGASVINMSLGGTAESQALCSAVSAAVARVNWSWLPRATRIPRCTIRRHARARWRWAQPTDPMSRRRSRTPAPVWISRPPASISGAHGICPRCNSTPTRRTPARRRLRLMSPPRPR